MILGIGEAYNGEHRAYRQAAKKLGAKAFLFNIDSGRWLDNLRPADAYVWHADSKEENYRVIHDRIYFFEKILRRPIFPDLNMYFAYGDKIKENDIFKFHGIPAPRTFVTYKKEGALSFARKAKYPFVLKDAHGYGGRHVHLVKNRAEAGRFVEKIFSPQGLKHDLATMKDYFLAQEFIKINQDLRVIMIGDKVVCAYWRKNDKDWKHNINLGGQAIFADVPESALDLCRKFHRKMRFHWMSYDLFVDEGGQALMNEFSCNFGIKGPTEAGYDIRRLQIEYILKRFV